MPAIFEAESTLTDRYQTTVPKTVRRALRLGKRDSIPPDGEVVRTRAGRTEETDPALGAFLAFLTRDIADHPERLQAVDPGRVECIQSLVAGLEVDLDAPLAADNE